MTNVLNKTNFNFPKQTNFYKGKVRDIYIIDNKILIIIATDRISSFDIVLPKGIPYKGQVLNQIAEGFLDATETIIPNWKIAVPDPMVSVGILCKPFKIEMVIRGYLSGHAWREYKQGKRTICGVSMPDGMKENDKFPEPIITPSTKEDNGHDKDISKKDILSDSGKLISKNDYEKLEYYTKALFKRGTDIANKMGLILVDTKYEFGKYNDKIYLIDEIHTPDSSRYFYKKGYNERQKNNEPQKQLSKEFVREWLMKNDFYGQKNQKIPKMTNEFVNSVSERYIELYENITGKKFIKYDGLDIQSRIESNINNFFKTYDYQFFKK
jgi:phosphoribosylaminoimidazole-succinocarboxamide synthase